MNESNASAVAPACDDLSTLRGWQPISTAPKDGSYILVSNEHGAWIAHWAPVAVSGYRFDQPWRSVMLNHDHIFASLRYLPPTHWVPLPAPPEADSASKASATARTESA